MSQCFEDISKSIDDRILLMRGQNASLVLKEQNLNEELLMCINCYVCLAKEHLSITYG